MIQSGTVITTEIIEKFIIDHTAHCRPNMSMLQEYHRGKNTYIESRKNMDANGPDNRTPIPYARKLITTFTGYAFKPGSITYRKNLEGNSAKDGSPEDAAADDYIVELQNVFKENNEPLKTAKIGQSLGIFGSAFEIVYLEDMGADTELRFFESTPIDTFMVYDYSAEPKPVFSIRYLEIDKSNYMVEYRSDSETVEYIRAIKDGGVFYSEKERTPHLFGVVPVIEYVINDDKLGLIEPVKPLIDDYDILVSDSLNEFQKFANAYLRFVGTGLVDPQNKKDPSSYAKALNMLKRFRIFEHLKDKDDVTFLTKDIPKDFLEFMIKTVHDQIHVQSHIPDFTESKFGQGASGETIKRMLFDFENVCSTSDAYLDEGLYKRIDIINAYFKVKKINIVDDVIQINHKRNLSDSLSESADIAVKLKSAGFSSELIAESMPKELVPDVDAEIVRQKEEMGLDIQVNG